MSVRVRTTLSATAAARRAASTEHPRPITSATVIGEKRFRRQVQPGAANGQSAAPAERTPQAALGFVVQQLASADPGPTCLGDRRGQGGDPAGCPVRPDVPGESYFLKQIDT
jgi:hypothetical protein